MSWEGVVDEAGFDALAEDPTRSNPMIAELADTLGLGEWSRPTRGSALIALGDEVVLKIMAPHDHTYLQTERDCLVHLQGRLPITTPELLQQGEFRGWPWVLMRRLPGRELTELWPALTMKERVGLAEHLGGGLAVLHSLEAPASIERVDWKAWVDERLGSIERLQRKRGAAEPLLQGLDAFVADADLSAGRTGWLHTEVMLEHLLVEQEQGKWRLSGMFDFEPAWVGPVDYEFASVGLFVGCGVPEILGAVMRAAGVDASPQRLFGMAMMHRYANLGWYHGRLGGPTDCHALAEAWFSGAGGS